MKLDSIIDNSIKYAINTLNEVEIIDIPAATSINNSTHVDEIDSIDANEMDVYFETVNGGYKQCISEHVGKIPDIIDIWEASYEGTDFVGDVHNELLNVFGEATYSDLRNSVDDFLRIRQKSKLTPGSRYQKTVGNIIYFKTDSHTIPGVEYDQYVKLVDLPSIFQKYQGSMSMRDIVRRAINGNIEVHCTDPSWLYWGFQYIGTVKDYAIEPESRPPVIRNPRLRGAVCKHLDNVLYILPFQTQKIVADIGK